MKSLLSVRNLCVNIRTVKQYDKQLSANHDLNAGFQPVKNINFDLYEGEICGIVGESGCGKTLTSLSIAGLLPPAAAAEGSIFYEPSVIDLLTLNDEEYCSIRGREISMIFQEPFSSLNPLLRIGDQVTETLEIHRGKKERAQYRSLAVQIMGKLGLENPEKLLDAYPFQLSGGMCQRVMIALAMICGPKILIADEPTTALDLKTQEQILKLIKEINKSGVSILFISHDLGVIKSVCNRVMVMYAGRIVEEGSVDEVFNNPLHEYTRLLLGALPERAKKGEKLQLIPGVVPSADNKQNYSAGCPFAPRCVKADAKCRTAMPDETIANENHKYRCNTGGK